jgi:hypothetical protein
VTYNLGQSEPSEPQQEEASEPPIPEEEYPANVAQQEESGETKAAAGELDHNFIQRFLHSSKKEDDSGEEGKKDEEKLPFFSDDYGDIFTLIDDYESVSGFRLAIRRSKNGGRHYCCASHEQCTFKAQFGHVRGSPEFISLKPNYSCFVHNGPLVAELSRDGRAKKRRLARKVSRAITKVATVKALPVTPRDAVKSSVNTEQFDINYKQGHSVLAKYQQSGLALSKAGYQRLVPYLEEFGRLNPGSAAISELDDNNHLYRVFVCPSIMQWSLAHVRPVMSLDAAHLKTTGGGGINRNEKVRSGNSPQANYKEAVVYKRLSESGIMIPS